MTSPTSSTSDSPAGSGGTVRAIVSRRGLPTGRALLGALLVTVAAVGTFAIATSSDDGPDTTYLVLVDDVQAGDTIELTDIAPEAMTLPPEVAATAVHESSGLAGATALHLLRAGTVLDTRSISGTVSVDGAPVTGVHELTFPVPRDRSPSALRLGDRVTVLAFDPQTEVLHTALEDALVLRFDDTTAGIGGGDEARLTVALPDPDLVVEATLRSYDSITVVLTSRAVDDHYPGRTGTTTGPLPPDAISETS